MTMIKEEMKDLPDVSSDRSLSSSQSSRDSHSSFEMCSFMTQLMMRERHQRRSEARTRRHLQRRQENDKRAAEEEEEELDDLDEQDEAERQERLERQSNLSPDVVSNTSRHEQQFKLNHSDKDEHQQPLVEHERGHQHSFAQLKQQFNEHQQQFQQQQQQQFQYSQLISGLAATNTSAGNTTSGSFLDHHQQQFYAIHSQPQAQQQQQPQKPAPPPPSSSQSQQQPQQQLGLDGRPKRNPYCSRCRNHGKSAQVKGHKRHCEYRDCQCEGCKLVECRQIVSAAQIKRRRYQKQDEECGRRIEVSPPVLTREPNSDPAAIIAKTLIGSASSKHHASSAQKQLVAAAISSGSTPAAASAAMATTATTTLPLQSGHSSHPALLGLPAISSMAPTASSAALAIGQPAASAKSGPAPHRPHLHPLMAANQQLGGPAPPPFPLATGKQQHKQLAAGPSQPSFGSALDEALHFFQFPSSVLSALGGHQQVAAAASLQSSNNALLSGAAAVAASLTALTGTGSAPPLGPAPNVAGLPNAREQFSLVEEIHQAFGPLAVYAWLRAEHFNLPKIRQTIELARLSFDELCQINGHSPLDLTSPIVD